MKKWTYLLIAVISMLIAMLFTSLLYHQLQYDFNELVTIRTTLLSYRIKITSTYHKTIYFEIDQPPYEIQYGDPHKYERELLQRSREKDTVNLTYRRIYSHISGSEEYWLHGMESLTDGQIILTPSDLDYDGRWNWLFSTFFVIFSLFIFFWALAKWLTHSPEEAKEVEIAQEPSFKEVPQELAVKEKSFNIEKPEPIIEALRTNRRNTRAWLILGWMMTKEGKPEQARECYERAFKINLSSYEAGELSALSLPTWVDLVAAEEEVALISNDLYPSTERSFVSRDNDPLPTWLDEEQNRSFFSPLQIICSKHQYFTTFITMFLLSVTCLVIFLGANDYPRVFVLSLLFILPIIWLFLALKWLQQFISSRRWPTNEAIVIGSFVRRVKYKKKPGYGLYVVCAHPVDKQIYYSTLPSEDTYIGSIYEIGNNQSEHDFQQKENEYSFARPIMVFYNPRQPDIVLHQAGINDYSFLFLIFLFAFWGVLGSWVSLYGLFKELTQ